MKWTKFLRMTILGVVLTFHNAHAMLNTDLEVENPNIPVVKQSVRINLSEHEKGKPLSVTLESQNLFIRNTTDDKGVLDYYFQIFSDQIIMEQIAKFLANVPLL